MADNFDKECPGIQLVDRICPKYPVLRGKAEVLVIRKAKDGDEEARQKLFLSNILLVKKIVHRYCGYGISFPDLMSIGMLGLMRAFDNYDLTRQCRFSTYCVPWIRQSILRAIETQARTIRLPARISQARRDIYKIRALLEVECGRPVTSQEIAQRLKIPRGLVEEFESYNDTVSLDQIDHDLGFCVTDTIVDESCPDYDKETIKAIMADKIRSYLAKLSDKERFVICARFGLEGFKQLQLGEIGKLISLSRERVRQIEARALIRLRQYVSNDPMFV